MAPTPAFPWSRPFQPLAFERQLVGLRRWGTPVEPTDALRRLRDGKPLPPRAYCVTFDDGYRDNLTLALPALQRTETPSMLFVAPGLIDEPRRAWWETLAWAFSTTDRSVVEVDGRTLSTRSGLGTLQAELKLLDWRQRDEIVEKFVRALEPVGTNPADELFLDWDGLREVVAGGMEIGSHTWNHSIVSHEAPADLRSELLATQARLGTELDVEVTVLAYPNGMEADWDSDAKRVVTDVGIEFAMTGVPMTNRRWTDPLELGRSFVDTERGGLGIARAVADRPYLWLKRKAGR